MTVLNMRYSLLTVTLKSRILRLLLGCAKAKGGIRITQVNLPVRCYPLFMKRCIILFEHKELFRKFLDEISKLSMFTEIKASA